MVKLWQFSIFLLFFLFLKGNIPPAFAQNLQRNYIHYSLENGLPSNMIYNCVQDQNGFLWFGSFAGLIRFDGHDFFTYSTKHGLPDNEILSTGVDSLGRVWAYPYSKNPIYIYQNKIHTEKNDSILRKVENNSMVKFHAGKNGGMWLFGPSYNEQNIIYYYEKSKVRTYKIPAKYKPIAFNYIDTLIQLICMDSIIYPQHPEKDTASGLRQKLKKGLKNYYEYTPDGLFILLNLEESCILQKYVNREKDFFPVLKQEVVLPKKVMCTYYNNGTLYLAFRSGGYMTLDENHIHYDSTQIQLKEASIGGIIKDKSGSLWFATLGSGIYCLPSNSIYSLSSQLDKNLPPFQSIWKEENGDFYIGNSQGEVQRYNVNYQSIFKIHIGTGNRILHIEKSKFNPEDLYIVSDEGFYIWHNYQKITKPEIEKIVKTAAKDVYQEEKTRSLWIGTSAYLYQYYIDNHQLVEKIKKRITAIHQLQDIYFGSKDGLYKWQNGKEIFLGKKTKELNCRITDLIPEGKNGLWVATSSEGVLLVRNDSVIMRIDKDKGLNSDIITKIYKDYLGSLWIGTDNGLNKWSYAVGQPQKGQIYTFGTKNGLKDNTINDILINKDTIFIISYKGLSLFKDNFAANQKHIPIYFTRIAINTRDTILKEKYILFHYENTLAISFTGICLGCNNEINYFYRLVGNQENWQITNQKQVEFGALPPGDYIFEVYAQSTKNQIYKVYFKILPPWWKTTWAIFIWVLLLLAALGFLTYFTLNYFRKQIQKKHQEENRMKELEMQALRSQMNPHFIFNCLSSIQFFVNNGEIESANRYMDKFAKLIRKTLDFSQNAVNSVEEEIAYLDNYLLLEKMRFEDKFHYFIEVNGDIDTEDVYLPSLILQPFVENAIRHGIRHKPGKEGEIWVRFYEENDYIVCEVQDNGIGRKKAAELKSKQHIEYQSQGMLLSQNRLALLSNVKSQTMKIEIIDLLSENQQPSGTLIRIFISKNL